MLTNPPTNNRSWFGAVMAFFFHQLYHTFAGFYDLVAHVVSLGQWKNWVTGIAPFINGTRILEIGFGPGHLQRYLNQIPGLIVFGLDESKQMAGLAQKRLRKEQSTYSNRLVRSIAEQMPFGDSVFDSIVATFPTPYIINPYTVTQINRVLKPGGRLVVLLAARHSQNSLPVKIADWLFAVTGQAPPEPEQSARITSCYAESGMVPSLRWETTESGPLLLLIAIKPKSN